MVFNGIRFLQSHILQLARTHSQTFVLDTYVNGIKDTSISPHGQRRFVTRTICQMSTETAQAY